MRKEADTVENQKLTLGAVAAILVAILSATWVLMGALPRKEDVESQDARATKIVAWVKEVLGEEKKDRVDADKRIEAQAVENQKQLLRELEIIQGDVKNILSRIPRKVVSVPYRGPAGETL